ncbi:MAG: efflux RND transporter permease subunit [Betaproteobacteria bacterium]|jgi:multidrug efflux pump subunit AcrB|nr:efflux RND transporter permease subunit [Betaproteobacteria bacterium]
MFREHFNLSRWAIEHPALVRYLMVVLLLMGIGAYFQLGQDEDPPFTFRAMVIRAAWPGATAMQVAEQVTDRLERTLQEVPYADKIRSYSRPGESLIIFQLKDTSPPSEVSQIWYTVRKKIGDARASLPAGVQGPFFNDEFGDTFGVIYAMSAPGYAARDVRDFANQVRQELLRTEDVGKVEIYGLQEERVYIELSRRRLAQYQLTVAQVANQIGAQNAIESGGTLSTDQRDLTLRVEGAVGSLEALREMPLRSGGQLIRLGDIAEIRRQTLDPPQTKVRFQGQEVVALGVSMRRGGDIVALGERLKTRLVQIQNELPAGVSLSQVQDQPQVVARSVSEFVRTLTEAIVIVLGVSLLALGLHRHPWRIDPRPGLVVAISIPLVLAVTFLIMKLWGVGLHKISLGSLIIALGLLVDDAIIVVEMMVRKLEEGEDRISAVTAAYSLTAMPMLTGTLITAAGFLPIGIAKSTVGEYTFAIFAVTAAALIVSWFVSVIFVPYLGYRMLRAPKTNGAVPQEHFDTPFYRHLRSVVAWCVDYRKTTIAITVVVLLLGTFGMSRVQQQFFPDSSRPEIMVDVWLPEGASVTASEEYAKRLERRMLEAPGVASVTFWVGTGAPRFFLPLDQILPRSNVSQAVVVAKTAEDRKRLIGFLSRELPQAFPEARIRVRLLPNGPPVPYPVQFRVVGPEPQTIKTVAEDLKATMRQDARLLGVNDNWNEQIAVVRVDVDPARAQQFRVSAQSVAQVLAAQFSGVPVGQYREADRLLPIVLRLPQNERLQTAQISETLIPSASGLAVPLHQVATVKPVWEPGIIWREGREYAVTVQADVIDGVQGATMTSALLKAFEPINSKLPAGVRIEVGGAVEESSKGQLSIAAGMPIMLFIIFTLLVIQLQSFSRAVLVFLTGPMGIAGAAVSLLVLDRPFGFVAMLGVIALSGMIMRNSIILIDQIEQDRRRGIPDRSAVIESAVRRFRPIVLTAAAAVLAMIPLSNSVFWGPMAVAIMGGLMLATVLTVLSLPAMYAAWFRISR